MESQLSFLANRAVSPSASVPQESAPAHVQDRSANDRRDFAEVLTGQSLKTQRQHLAALGKNDHNLQVLPLGNKINVITSDDAQPDLDSLAQFARQQGLDEAAVQALFGTTLTSPGATVAGFATTLDTAALGGIGRKDTDATLASAADWAAAGVQMSVMAPMGGTTPLVAVAPMLGEQALATSGGFAARAAPTSATTGLVPALYATANVQATLTPTTGQVGGVVTAPTVAEATAPAADLAPQDALRLTLAMPAPEITKRLAQMSGTGKESTWAALLASGPLSKDAMGAATETLSLDIPPDYDLGLDGLAPSNTETSNRELPAPTSGAAQQVVAQAAAGGSANSNSQAQADHRAQQFQQIADQMGHAAAQRLIAQIERGQWKMQMRMQPASLGNIQVELDMHAGGLDALFSADSAVTRELMTQGSNKLRDTLASAGMTVASVTVNADQNRQSGGNPTPGKGRSAAPAVGPVSSSSEAAALASRSMDTTQSDGLNVLA